MNSEGGQGDEKPGMLPSTTLRQRGMQIKWDCSGKPLDAKLYIWDINLPGFENFGGWPVKTNSSLSTVKNYTYY